MPRLRGRSSTLKSFPDRLDAIARAADVDACDLEVWFGDQARVGQKNKLTRRWAIAEGDPPEGQPAERGEGVAVGPGGWPGLAYYRLHGSPEMYYSAYGAGYLDALAEAIAMVVSRAGVAWCIFDNRARSEAARNALDLPRRVTARDNVWNASLGSVCPLLCPLPVDFPVRRCQRQHPWGGDGP